ncbi:Cof-type HAD-IIB family hydrolase [Microbacterium sp. YY-01]|uniref:Cof-type HAD-IIB family hydrolase n=1 Tax=Microbacterium sp. YY-01 TaxID=3421634 RepID=UPI003D16A70E
MHKNMASSVRLIATDLDGTLLTSGTQVSPRTRQALDAARAAGILVVPVTARQPIGLRAVAADADFTQWALCGNGAFGIHLTTSQVLFAEEIPTGVQARLATELTQRVDGLRFASVRDAGEVFIAQEGYAALAHHFDHKRDPATMSGVQLDDVVSEPSLKLVVRHPEISPAELYETVRSMPLDGFEATLSGAPFVEIMAAGVTKASGLARLCTHLGVAQHEVVAFGDAANDREMLRWAGHGIAMANAVPEALSAADQVAMSNDDDGVARIIEALLDAR